MTTILKDYFREGTKKTSAVCEDGSMPKVLSLQETGSSQNYYSYLPGLQTIWVLVSTFRLLQLIYYVYLQNKSCLKALNFFVKSNFLVVSCFFKTKVNIYHKSKVLY